MKNDFTQTRVQDRYFLKMQAPVGSGIVRRIKSIIKSFRKTENKLPFLGEAVSQGILDFFEEMGYPANRKIE